MSWNLSAQSCCFELTHVTQESTFDELLNLMANEIWTNFAKNESTPEHFEDHDIPESRIEAIPFIANELKNYIIEFDCTEKGASFIIYSEYDTEDRSDSDLADKMAEFFLLNSDQNYCLTQSAAFDRTGGYAHQWITIKEGKHTRTMHMHRFMDMLTRSENHSLPSIKEMNTYDRATKSVAEACL